MKLYNEKNGYTVEAMNFDDEVHNAVKVIFEKYIAMGCNIRELSHIAIGSISSLESETVLNLRFGSKK